MWRGVKVAGLFKIAVQSMTNQLYLSSRAYVERGVKVAGLFKIESTYDYEFQEGILMVYLKSQSMCACGVLAHEQYH